MSRQSGETSRAEVTRERIGIDVTPLSPQPEVESLVIIAAYHDRRTPCICLCLGVRGPAHADMHGGIVQRRTHTHTYVRIGRSFV